MGSITKDSYINAKKKTNIITVLLNKGDIVMPKDDIGNGSIICKTAVIEENNKYVLGDHVYRILVKSENPYFVSLLINSPTIHNALMKKVTGSAQLGININSVLNQKILIPSLLEQEKISNLFKNMDNLIKFHQHKLILLNKYKEGLYKTIFSNVSVESKVSLKDIIMPLKKTSHKSGDGKADGKYIFFTNTTSKNFKYFDSYDYDEEIIIANTGGTANFKYYKGKFAAMSDCYIFKTSENTQYIYYWLDYMKDIIDRLGFRGNGIKHLDKRWFLSLTLELPSFTEQTKIVNLLNSFDSIIYKETQTLNQLQKMKSGLLQQMFI